MNEGSVIIISTLINYTRRNRTRLTAFMDWFYERTKDIEPLMSYEDFTACLEYDLARIEALADLAAYTGLAEYQAQKETKAEAQA